ncbi:HNH endonuclease [Priestia megaterium]|uniref:HNH endonuclease n=1 Tax=Priestia megaterium TaxID=1404 RepID=UPI00234EDAC2|nr:HNH endonuclease [Priestia megaterium]MDC7724275.1 HNH endonuclease [Priestia megaterium]
MPSTKRPPNDELFNKYIIENKTQKQLAEEYNTSTGMIAHWLKYYQIRKLKKLSDVFTDSRGYIKVKSPNHPFCNIHKQVYQHVLIVEDYIGRNVQKHEEVHHLDHNKSNNRLNNLVLFPNKNSHVQFHKYEEKIALYLLGITKQKPDSIKFTDPVLFLGCWVYEIELIDLAESISEQG